MDALRNSKKITLHYITINLFTKTTNPYKVHLKLTYHFQTFILDYIFSFDHPVGCSSHLHIPLHDVPCRLRSVAQHMQDKRTTAVNVDTILYINYLYSDNIFTIILSIHSG